jgi:hypothetical protein
MSFDDDNRDAPFIRPAATIRIFTTSGEEIDVIEIPELVIKHPFSSVTSESDAEDQQ